MAAARGEVLVCGLLLAVAAGLVWLLFLRCCARCAVYMLLGTNTNANTNMRMRMRMRILVLTLILIYTLLGSTMLLLLPATTLTSTPTPNPNPNPNPNKGPPEPQPGSTLLLLLLATALCSLKAGALSAAQLDAISAHAAGAMDAYQHSKYGASVSGAQAAQVGHAVTEGLSVSEADTGYFAWGAAACRKSALNGWPLPLLVAPQLGTAPGLLGRIRRPVLGCSTHSRGAPRPLRSR